MSNSTYFDSLKERQRIKEIIDQEQNPYHKQHIAEFSAMLDERIQSTVPQMIHDQQEEFRVNIETYLNGKRVRNNSDIMKGVRNVVANALKSIKGNR